MNAEVKTPSGISVENVRELLAERLAAQDQPSPLSFAQHRLWFLDQLEPNSPLYNIPSVVRLKGKLDAAALEQSISAIVARHESLRTRFASNDGEPAQVVDEHMKIALEQKDLVTGPRASASGNLTDALPTATNPVSPLADARGSVDEREAELERRIDEELKRPFDLGSGPLLRATLLRIASDEHVLILNMHHIVSDEWSLKIFFRELAEYYQGFVEGNPVSLPELPIQYGDYAVWQREWLNGPAFQKQLSYWTEQLSGNPAGVELPADHPRKGPRSSRGAVQTRAFSRELSVALKDLANREGATLFMVMLAAFKVLLFRYTQQQDLIVGSPMAGRTRMETENLIGFFVNTLPLRTRVSGDMTFEQLLKQVREVALGAYSHQELPFEKIVEALHPERALNETPFVRVMFLLQNGWEELRLPGLTVEFLECGTGTAKFDATLGVVETGDGLLAGMEYNTDLFEGATITRWLQHYESLLHGIAADPTKRISELPLLSQDERRQLVNAWSASARPASVVHPSGSETPESAPNRGHETTAENLTEWFEAQAERTPEATAVVCESHMMTYRELNDRANQLARYLRGLGVGPEVPVALHLERSLDMVIAVLGVLKAGGAYLPMDPAYPPERLSFMLDDSKAPVVLTMEHLRDTLPASETRWIVCLDSDSQEIATDTPKREENRRLTGDNAAYIIYTSGSTGKPKGVMVTHHNVVRLFKETQPWYGFDENDTWTLFHSYTFDFSVWELWGALLYGGRLVVVPYLISRSPGEFYKLLAHEKVTVLNQTPSAFRQLLWAEATAPAQLPLSLRYVIFGGEALELQSLKPWFERHGDAKPVLVNMYGITETTVHVTYRVIRQADLNSGIGSVIGVPIPDLKIYLLDEKLEPVPTGVPGEICVAGAGVARGYLNRPELTSQRFIGDPFSGNGARLYRSGDLARYTSGGELEYLGRMDHQVKIRGFRVELGEIESALNRHPGIRESIVIAADGPDGAKRLVAYVVSQARAALQSRSVSECTSCPSPVNGDGTSRLDLSELRAFLGKTLPDYMVPTVFVVLAALPLTSNGKVDRRALPAPGETEAATGADYVAPRTHTETVLVDIWCGILGRKSVSIHENFFHLGGHSLLATQVIWRIAGALNVELPVRAIFEAPTVAALAEAVGRAQPAGTPGLARRTRAPKTAGMLGRLGQLSDDDLQRLLRNPKLRDVLDESDE